MVIIYGRNGHRVLEAVASGLHALGLPVVWRRHSVFTPDQVERNAAFVVVYGLQGQSAVVADTYRKAGIRVLVLDAAYYHRELDYHQAGWGGLNSLPAFPCHSDRFNAWEKVQPAKRGDKVLILGQTPNDAQIPPKFDPRKWAVAVVSDLRHTTGRPVVWKPHPKCEGMQVDADETVTGPLNLDGIHTAVTFNSTAAYQCLLAGIPVVCDPSAVYAPLCYSKVEDGMEVGNVGDFFNRLAYGQWTTDELADGSALRFLLHGQQGNDEGADAQGHEGTPADAPRHAETARRDDEGRKPRRQKGVKRGANR